MLILIQLKIMKYLIRIYENLTKFILSLSNKWYGLMYAVTLLAGPVFVSVCTVLFVLTGWLGKKPVVLQVGLLIIITHLIVTLLKWTFRKARPDTEYARNIMFSKYSFPSGHSAVGFVLWYGMVIVMSNLALPGLATMLLGIMVPFLVMLIGISRVYLGAHFLIDVLVGWVIGFVMMIGFVILALKPF